MPRNAFTALALVALSALAASCSGPAPRPASSGQPAASSPSPDAGAPRPPAAAVAPLARPDLGFDLALGRGHACARKEDGGVWCWGLNTYGQLGDGTRFERATAARVRGVTDAAAVATGNMFSCALHATGAVSCWGARAAAGPGASMALSPEPIAGLADVVAISAGTSHACALTAARRVRCWGDNREGQLGDGTKEARPAPVDVVGVDDAIAVAAGDEISCALLGKGGVACWGQTRPNRRADGLSPSPLTPTRVVGADDAVAVSHGFLHTCILRKSGAVACWGWLGQSTAEARSAPTDVAGIAGAVKIAAGSGARCALLGSGEVRCWGTSNTKGELGRGQVSNENRALEATPVVGVTGATKLVGGFAHFCTGRGDRFHCWGENTWGELGVPSHLRALAPAPVPELDGAKEVATGTLETCGVVGGRAVCVRRAGNRVTLPGPADVTSLAVGATTCIVHASGRVACPGMRGPWSACTHDPVPRLDAVQVASTSGRGCAVARGGGVACWADVKGDVPREATRACEAAQVAGLTGIAKVAVGAGKLACALSKAGSVSCWEGDGKPVQIAGIADGVDLAVGDAFACVAKKTGAVACWGKGGSGQLANGARGDSSAPVEAVGLADVTRVAASGATGCALSKGGQVSCWGDGNDGLLGVGTDEPFALRPAPVSGLTDATAIAVGGAHACAVTRAAKVVCWGSALAGGFGPEPVIALPAPRPLAL